MVRLCPRCGGLMKPVRERGSSYLVCTRCGHRLHEVDSQASLKISSKIEHTAKEKTIILEEQREISKLPITREVRCKRCGHNEAYYWFLQTRAADEPPTRFYRCVKCGYVWREYE